MLQDCDQFDCALLEVVFNDIVPLESIVAKLSQQPTAGRELFNTKDLQTRLLLLIADDLVGAYLIHAESPYVTAVEAKSDTSHRYWYRITTRGRRRLRDLREMHDRIYLERSA
jgi:hypothetical protein